MAALFLTFKFISPALELHPDFHYQFHSRIEQQRSNCLWNKVAGNLFEQ